MMSVVQLNVLTQPALAAQGMLPSQNITGPHASKQCCVHNVESGTDAFQHVC